jgi:hypothetical protein
MIKVDVLRKKDAVAFVFETRDVSKDGLEKFDELFSAIVGSVPKEWEYLDSNRFRIEVKFTDPV